MTRTIASIDIALYLTHYYLVLAVKTCWNCLRESQSICVRTKFVLCQKRSQVHPSLITCVHRPDAHIWNTLAYGCHGWRTHVLHVVYLYSVQGSASTRTEYIARQLPALWKFQQLTPLSFAPKIALTINPLGSSTKNDFT